MRKLLRGIVVGAGLLPLLAAGAAGAQAYPTKPLRMILPFPPGGPTDLLGRAIAQKLGEQMGQTVIADNRPGAGGNLGIEVGAKSPPDGYHMVLTSSVVAIAHAMYPKLNWELKDLAPISLVAEIKNVILVHPNVPARNVKELIALAKAQPGKLNYGSGGVGTTTHITPELMMSLSHTKMVHVPYKGSGLALIALVGGQVDMLVMAVAAGAGQVKAGKVRAIGILSTERSVALPEVPTVKEQGYENFIVKLWYGILVPAATPPAIIGRLNSELVKALTSADLKKRLTDGGVEPLTSTPEEFGAFIAKEAPRYANVIKEAGIKPE